MEKVFDRKQAREKIVDDVVLQCKSDVDFLRSVVYCAFLYAENTFLDVVSIILGDYMGVRDGDIEKDK